MLQAPSHPSESWIYCATFPRSPSLENTISLQHLVFGCLLSCWWWKDRSTFPQCSLRCSGWILHGTAEARFPADINASQLHAASESSLSHWLPVLRILSAATLHQIYLLKLPGGGGVGHLGKTTHLSLQYMLVLPRLGVRVNEVFHLS